MKLSEQVEQSLKSYLLSPFFKAENTDYLRKMDKQLVEKVQKLEEALAFYANEDNWNETYLGNFCDCCGPDYRQAETDIDEGAKARAALKEVE